MSKQMPDIGKGEFGIKVTYKSGLVQNKWYEDVAKRNKEFLRHKLLRLTVEKVKKIER